MPAAGNGPVPTSPLLITDEHIAIELLTDYALLAPHYQTLGMAKDGYFTAGAPWVLNSPTVNFQSYGVAAQNVVVIDSPPQFFPGGAHLFAVDSVSGNACTLRRLGLDLNMGQPPAPQTGIAGGVSFTVPYLRPTIDKASWEIKRFVRIDEQIFCRSTPWMYQGAEDLYRTLRDAVVAQAAVYLFEPQSRGGDDTSDWHRKLTRAQKRLDYIKNQIEVRWGPFGNSSPPTNSMGGRVTR